MVTVTDELSYSIRPKVLLTYLGQLLIPLAFMTIPPLAASLYFGEYSMAMRFGLIGCILGSAGFLLAKINLKVLMQSNESMVLAAIFFIIAPLAFSYPMMTTGVSFGAALFETISAITTTGLSVVPSIEKVTPAFLFSRAWMQWFGALSIVVFSLVLITQPGIVTTVAELQEDDLTGGIKNHAKRIFKIYFIVSVVGIIGTLLFNIGLFDSILFIFASISTGGFSPYPNSFANINIYAQWWITIISLIGAMPLLYFYKKLCGMRSLRMDNIQIKTLIALSIIVTIILAMLLHMIEKMGWSQIIHHAPLLAISAQSTTGYSSFDISNLDLSSKLLLSFTMLVGGSVGSTSGGFKLLRFLIAINIFRFILLKTSLSRHAVAEPHLGERQMEYSEIAEGLILIISYLAVIAISWAIFVIMGYNPINALFEVTSATGTVGLSVGVTNSELPTLLKWVLCFDMLMGRLEIFAWIVLLYPKTWFGKRTGLI